MSKNPKDAFAVVNPKGEVLCYLRSLSEQTCQQTYGFKSLEGIETDGDMVRVFDSKSYAMTSMRDHFSKASGTDCDIESLGTLKVSSTHYGGSGSPYVYDPYPVFTSAENVRNGKPSGPLVEQTRTDKILSVIPGKHLAERTPGFSKLAI